MTSKSTIPFANDTITIYNQYQTKNAGGKLITGWKNRQVPNCFIEQGKNTIGSGGIILTSDDTTVKIPLYDNFVNSYEWANLTVDDLDNYFTAKAGDLIVLMAVDDVIDPFMTDLDILTKYGSMASKITKVFYNYGNGKPHQHIAVIL